LQGADLTGADLRGATLIKANLGGAQLDNGDVSYANLFLARVNISLILARDLTETDLTSVTFVYEDEKGEDIWDSYADSIAESPEEENGQARINSACASSKYNAAQSKNLPITLPKRACKKGIDYSMLQWWEAFGYPRDLTTHSGSASQKSRAAR
jgi:Pentapeptide repeats (8 copies)